MKTIKSKYSILIIILTLLNFMLLYIYYNNRQYINEIETKYLNSINTLEDIKVLKAYEIIYENLISTKLDSLNLVFIIPESSCISCINSEVLEFKKYKHKYSDKTFGFYITSNKNNNENDFLKKYTEFKIIESEYSLINPITFVLDHEKNILFNHNVDPSNKYNLKKRKIIYTVVEQLFE